jgi:hypothetical protein
MLDWAGAADIDLWVRRKNNDKTRDHGYPYLIDPDNLNLMAGGPGGHSIG